MSGATRQARYIKKHPERAKGKGHHHHYRKRVLAPSHINALRAAYCDQFMKTGVLNSEIIIKLKEYADECKAATINSQRVSTEHETENYRTTQPQRTLGCGRGSDAGNNCPRDDYQTDGAS